MQPLRLFGVFMVAVYMAAHTSQATNCKRYAECYCPSSHEMRCAGTGPINIGMLQRAAAIYWLEILDLRGRIFSVFFIRDVLQSCPRIVEIRAENCDCEAVRPYLHLPHVKITHSCSVEPQEVTTQGYEITTSETESNDTFPFIPWWFITDAPEDTEKPTETFPTEDYGVTTEDYWVTTEDYWETVSTPEGPTPTPRKRHRVSPPNRRVTPKTRGGIHHDPTPAYSGYGGLTPMDNAIIGWLSGSIILTVTALSLYFVWRTGYFNPPRDDEEEARQQSSICGCFRRCMRRILPRRQGGSQQYEMVTVENGSQAQDAPLQDGNPEEDPPSPEGADGGSFEDVQIEDIGSAEGGEMVDPRGSFFRRRSPFKRDFTDESGKAKTQPDRKTLRTLITKIQQTAPRITVQQLREFYRDIREARQARRSEDEFDHSVHSEMSSVILDVSKLEEEADVTYLQHVENVESLEDTGQDTGLFQFHDDDTSISSIEVFNVQKVLARKKAKDRQEEDKDRNEPGTSKAPTSGIEKSGDVSPLTTVPTLERQSDSDSLPSDTPPISIFFPEESKERWIGDGQLDMSITDISQMSDVTLAPPSQESSSGLSGFASTAKYAVNFRPSSAPPSLTTSQEETEDDKFLLAQSLS